MNNSPSPLCATLAPATDPAPIFELFRGNFATELLTAAVGHFNVFGRLAARPMTPDELRAELGLAERPAVVLFTALRAFGLLTLDPLGRLSLSALARDHLRPGAIHDVSGYLSLAAGAPGVQAMIERLQTNRPAGLKPNEDGAAFIYREGLESAMENEAKARSLTLALAGRARNVAPVLAERLPLANARRLLDVGGGTGIYSIAWLQRHPELRAIVWDRPEVLKVTRETALAYGVSERMDFLGGDMFVDPLPGDVDVILLSNVLHDWDIPECQALISRCAGALPTEGRLLIHDVFLNDALDGPLPIALYSAALFTLSEGRAYSAAEYRQWLENAGLMPLDPIPTLAHCAVLEGRKNVKSED